MKKTRERCDICGKGGVVHRRLTRTYGKGATLLVVESYVTAETLHEIERIKLLRRSLAKPRSVRVASFG